MEYSYSPKEQNRNAITVSSTLLAAGVLCLIASSTLKPRSLWQLGFAVLISVSLMFWLRYHAMSYTYTVTDAYGEWQLLILGRQGRRETTLCCLSLARLSRVAAVTATDEESVRRDAMREFKNARARYNYSPTLGPRAFQVIYARENGIAVAVRIEGDAGFLKALDEAVTLARMQAPPEEEE